MCTREEVHGRTPCLAGLPSVRHGPIWKPFTAADEWGPRGAHQCAHLSSLHAEPERGGFISRCGFREENNSPCETLTGPNEEAEQQEAVVSEAVETGTGTEGAEISGEDRELLRRVMSSNCGRVLEDQTTSDCEDQRATHRGTGLHAARAKKASGDGRELHGGPTRRSLPDVPTMTGREAAFRLCEVCVLKPYRMVSK